MSLVVALQILLLQVFSNKKENWHQIAKHSLLSPFPTNSNLYGKKGVTTVMTPAAAIRKPLIRRRSSIRSSLGRLRRAGEFRNQT